MRKLRVLLLCGLLAACSPGAGGEPPEAEAPIQVSTDELQFCELVEQAITVEDCIRASLADEQAAQGMATLAYSKRMTVGDAQPINLTISRQTPPSPPPPPESTATEAAAPEPGPLPTAAPVEEAAPDAPEPPVATVTYQPIVGRFTSVRLDSPDFDITPREAVTKEIPRGGQEVWQWQVTPRREGVLTFSVVTNVQFKRTDGTYMALAQKVTAYEVTVGVGMLSRIRVALDAAPGWIKAVTAILVALGGLAGAWFALRRIIANRGEGAPPPADGSGDGAGGQD